MTQTSTPAYSPGLAGVIAGESGICEVDPNAGLIYRGYDVEELANKKTFEDVVWLLINGELPSAAQKAQLRKDLAEAAPLPQPVLDMLKLLSRGGHPMDMLRTGVSMLGMFDPDVNDHSHAANVRKAIRLVARMSTLTTSGWHIMNGREPFKAPASMGYMERFLFELYGKPPSAEHVQIMDAVYILYAEHEFNASTFSARVTAATMSDLYSAITSAVGTLKGPLHGGANEEAMAMLFAVGSPDKAESWVKDQLAKKAKIMGFGHRVYKKGDSRVAKMRSLAHQLARPLNQEPLVKTCEALEAIMLREKNLCSNLDLYAAPVFHLMKIDPQLNTPIFACGRIAGWAAHVIEQHDHNRLIRPRSIYTGPKQRPVP